jgi:hypothetical protein
MGALDPYRITDKLEDPLLDIMVSRLEARGAHWFFQKVLREYLDAMDIDSAGTVLDMGCGTGVAARTYARSRYPRWQLRCCGSAYAREPPRRAADGDRGGRQGRQARWTDRDL